MGKGQILEFKYCVGCGLSADRLAALVALRGPIYICGECVLTCSTILATEMRKDARIAFVDEMLARMKEPAEITAKWKELAESKVEQPHD